MNVIAQIQTLLTEAGFPLGPIDGLWGPKSQTALDTAVESLRTRTGAPPAAPISHDPSGHQNPVDARSEASIETLHPRVRPLARALVNQASASGIKIVITSGTRTYAEQDALYRQPTDGRDNDDDGRVDEADERVTKAPAGHSNHNFGLAFDVTIFRDGKPVWNSPQYATVGKLGRELGMMWGGNWSTPDEPHFELRPAWADTLSEPAMLAELRRRKEDGRDAFAV